jgi:hypothetical protein
MELALDHDTLLGKHHSSIFFFVNAVSAGTGPIKLKPSKLNFFITGIIIFCSSFQIHHFRQHED